MGTDKDFFKNPTAETSLDAARDPEPVEGQSTQREGFLPNQETTIGQKTPSLEEAGFCLSSSPDKQKMKFSASSVVRPGSPP